LDFGQAHAQPPLGVQASPLQEIRMRAELLLSQVQIPEARCACMQQEAIFQQQHKQQKQELQRQPKRGGSPGTPQTIANLAYFPNF